MMNYLTGSITSKAAYEQNTKCLIVAYALFFLMPIVGILLVMAIYLQDRTNDKRLRNSFFVLSALYMAAINVTKLPFSDQLQYMNAYLLVPNQSFLESLTNIYGDRLRATYKEMGYGLLNFIGYYLSFGSYKLFVAEFTVLLYLVLMFSISKFFHWLDIKPMKGYVVSAVFILCFFSQYFNLTIHIQRQVIATAVMIWALIDATVKRKPNWFVAIFAVTLHTSVALFIPFFIIIYVKKRLRFWHLVCAITVFCLSLSVLSQISSVFAAFLGEGVYGFTRLVNAGNSMEERFNTNIVLLFSAPTLYISLRELWRGRNSYNESVNLMFVAYCFLVCFSYLNPDNTMQYRFFMMSYSFTPFILPLLFQRMKTLRKPYLFIVSTFLLFRFYFTFDDMVWDYAPTGDVLARNFFWFFNYRLL